MWIAVGAVLVLAGAVVLRWAIRMRRVDLTTPPVPGEKPPWLATTPPPETVEATQADGEDGSLWDYDEGEQVAAPFAEQIEDVILARVAADPALSGYKLDLGTAADGSLEFWVDEQVYRSIDDLPDTRLRQTIRQAVEYWNKLNQGD